MEKIIDCWTILCVCVFVCGGGGRGEVRSLMLLQLRHTHSTHTYRSINSVSTWTDMNARAPKKHHIYIYFVFNCFVFRMNDYDWFEPPTKRRYNRLAAARVSYCISLAEISIWFFFFVLFAFIFTRISHYMVGHHTYGTYIISNTTEYPNDGCTLRSYSTG